MNRKLNWCNWLGLVLVGTMLGSVAMSGCGKAEEEVGEAKNEVKQEANEKGD